MAKSEMPEECVPVMKCELEVADDVPTNPDI
jgi:hypothetical protein